MSRHHRHPKDYGPIGVKAGAVIDPDTLPEAMNFVELTETEWRIVAYRARSTRQVGENAEDWWDYTFPEIRAWKAALNNGRVICVHVIQPEKSAQPTRLALLGKLARRRNI